MIGDVLFLVAMFGAGMIVGSLWQHRIDKPTPQPSTTTRDVEFGIHDFARLVRGDHWVISYDDGVRVDLHLGDVGGFAGMRALLAGVEARSVGEHGHTEFTAAPTEGA